MSTFTDKSMSGFTVSGNEYLTEICIADSSACTDTPAYGVSKITADTWLYNMDAGYGVIGMGPTSDLWRGFVGVDGTAVYSIALARPPAGLTDARGN